MFKAGERRSVFGAATAFGLAAEALDADDADADAGVHEPIGVVGRNLWRRERAHRAAVLIDGSNYFGAVRKALLNAQRQIFIVGWDIHSRTRLVGERGVPEDGLPAELVPFLCALVKRRPELEIHLLLWDYSVLYAMERELFPLLTLNWKTPPQIRVCLDNELPIGSSQHQKLIVVDDALAFSGGLDVTIRRWDTRAHQFDNPHRRDPAGKPYRPFHDIQMVVDGLAAGALADLVRTRWERAACEQLPPVDPYGDPWPDGLAPDFRDIDIGIARTEPMAADGSEIREVEALYLDMVDAAERLVYVENQFLTYTRFARKLADRMVARPELEALFIAPQTAESWLEARTMRNGRIRFMRTFHEAGVGDRVRFLYPEVSKRGRSVDTMIHSKLIIVDDRLLRIGSANLNNRSMGTDTECDLLVEAASERDRRTIRELRDGLVAEHCGSSVEEVRQELARHGSMLRVAEELSTGGHCLRPVQDGEPDPEEISLYVEGVADPERPIPSSAFVTQIVGDRSNLRYGAWIKVGIVALVILGLTLAWQYTPLAEYADADAIKAMLGSFQGPWAPLLVVGAIVLGGLVCFPLMIMIAATAATFGPWVGLIYATIGAMLSALVTFGIGAKLGRDTLRNLLGPRLNRIRERIVQQGVISVAAIRLVPIAPFTVVNLVAGASQVKLVDFMLGTLLGLAPGLILLSALGHQILRVLTDPNPTELALLIAAIVAWIAVSFGIQRMVTRLWSSKA